jgi:hypothetical protein
MFALGDAGAKIYFQNLWSAAHERWLGYLARQAYGERIKGIESGAENMSRFTAVASDDFTARATATPGSLKS